MILNCITLFLYVISNHTIVFVSPVILWPTTTLVLMPYLYLFIPRIDLSSRLNIDRCMLCKLSILSGSGNCSTLLGHSLRNRILLNISRSFDVKNFKINPQKTQRILSKYPCTVEIKRQHQAKCQCIRSIMLISFEREKHKIDKNLWVAPIWVNKSWFSATICIWSEFC